MEFLLGGAAACCAGVITNPLEVVKTRVQLQGELRSRGCYAIHYKNVFHAFYAVAKADGVLALQKGLAPALWYQFFMNGVRLGTFHCLENFNFIKNSQGDVSVYRSICAGALSGCIGSLIGSPFYMVKTQLQAQSAGSVAVGYQHHYHGMFEAFSKIFGKHGILGLWRGVNAAMVRVTLGSAAQLATFSKSKFVIDEAEIFPRDSVSCALAASMLSGAVVVALMTPFDVISTRLYNQGVDSRGKGLLYRGVSDCFFKIFSTEGILGYYKGWSASLLRLGPHTVLSLMFWNEFRKYYDHISAPEDVDFLQP
ncbi:solute carrier family 25 member 35-like [Limulus polyphemus]|uniref:Solute carrier family 25 member 35-like n=1 Tax=Limulus polyphemus TaxID=6850 RepID=A0ABM1BXB3_LIMPO|nr:solute carrier family 25 member 35-like [Limulus polyphemus]